MGPARAIFEIPVYRCSLEQHVQEWEKEIEKFKQFIRAHGGHEPSRRLLEFFERDHWQPWAYNDVIGFLRVTAFGRQVHAEFWEHKTKRHVRRPARKVFTWTQTPWKTSCDRFTTSVEVYHALRDKIERFAQEPHMRRRFVDNEAFLQVGPFINWMALLRSDGRAVSTRAAGRTKGTRP